jgi:tetratricopeptide (TPR) repeat protein
VVRTFLPLPAGARPDRPALRALFALALSLALATGVQAQVSAPRMVGDEPAAEPARDEAGRGEGEEAPEEQPPPKRGRAGKGGTPPGTLPALAPGAREPERAPAARAAEPEPAPPTWLVYDQPPPPPPPEPSSDLARRLVPVSASWEKLVEAWSDRRRALREQDPARARAAEEALVSGQRELAIENLIPFAAALVRESGRSLEANHPAEAVETAELATRIAPDLADAHLALARARLARGPGDVGPILSAFVATFAAAAREPHTLRAFLADVVTAALAAIFAAAALTALLILAKKLRLFLHDFHHLPLLRGTAPVQSTFLALVLFATPIALGLGHAIFIGVAIAIAWLYLSLAERVMASVALLALVATPWLAALGVRSAAWTGTMAETVYELEHGAYPDADALAARWEGEAPPPALAAALGRHFKRRGDLAKAKRWYGLALAADDRAAEVQVNLGNVLFLDGDLDAAKAAYLGAADRAAGDLRTLAAAHYNLSKLYLRTSELEKSQAARDRAQQEDGAFLARFGSDEDFSANRFIVDVPVPARKIGPLASQSAAALELQAFVRGRLLGALPPWTWPWSGVGFVALLWLAALLQGRLAPSTPCERCGRPACHRCDGAAGPLCGQCVNAFVKKGVVDARDRVRKEAEVRRHGQVQVLVTRVLAVLGAGGAGLVWGGAVVAGFLFLLGILFLAAVVWLWRGVLPPPQPSPWVLVGKAFVAVPLGLLLYALAVRAAIRLTRE